MPNRAFFCFVALLCVATICLGEPAPINMTLRFGDDEYAVVVDGELQEIEDLLLSPRYYINLTIETDDELPVDFYFYNSSTTGHCESYDLVDKATGKAVPPISSVSSENPLVIMLIMKCEDVFHDPILLSFLFDDYDPIVVTLPIMCFEPGCTELCDVHGSCVESIGYCECDVPWTGMDCRSVFEPVLPAFCPGQEIQIKLALANVTGGEWYSMFDTDNEEALFDWNYLSEVVNTSSFVVGEPFPKANDGSFFILSIPAAINPTGVTIELYLDDDYTLLTDTSFTILPYTDPSCGTPDDNCSVTGCSGRGTCNEETGVCECDDKRNFWFDCSRGCKELTVVKETSGIIDSAGDEKPPLYNTFSVCTWILAPEKSGFDSIHIKFERFQLTCADRVRVMTVGENGTVDESSIQIDSFAGFSLPDERTYEDIEKIAFVLESDYCSFGSGFRISFEVITVVPVTGIVIGCTAAALIIIVVSGILIWRRKSKKASVVEAARHVRSVPLPVAKTDTEGPYSTAEESLSPTATDSMTDDISSGAGALKSMSSKRIIRNHGELEAKRSVTALNLTRQKVSHPTDDESLGWTKMQGLDAKVHVLQFDLESQATFPVMEDKMEKVMFSNNSSKPLQFRISHPVDEYVYDCYAEPGMGTLLPGYGVVVEFHFKLKYTTRVFTQFTVSVWNNSYGSTIAGFCGFNVPEGKEPDCTAYIATELEGAMSERIDPNDIVLASEPLGIGAFGIVYSGQYRQTLVAVKVMSRQQDLLEQIISDLEKEIELYRKLRNPLLVEFVGASLVPGKLCMCTELIKHGSLEQLINEVEIPFALQTKFALNIAEAVEFLHVNNVLYRDLKPSNVMIVSTSLGSKINCKIGDFGTARNVKDVTELFTYTTGQGTPIYMAPEILDVRAYNNKADVYSYAITLWQVFVREKPWSNVPVWNIPTFVVSGQRPSCPSSMPREYAELIRSCWSPSIDARPDFRAVIDTLLPIAKKARKEFKANPNAEQMLRKVQAATASAPAANVASSPSSTSKVFKGFPGNTEKSFTLGLTDVSGTASAGDKKNLASTASVSTEPPGAVIPEEILDDEKDKDDDSSDDSEEEKRKKIPVVGKQKSKHGHSSSKHGNGKHGKKHSKHDHGEDS